MVLDPNRHVDMATRVDRSELSRKLVYDPVLRLIHAWNALLVISLLITAQIPTPGEYSAATETVRRIHVWLGFGLVLGLTARLTWGFMGPKHARLTDLWHPKEWLQALRSWHWFNQPRRFGHHPEAALASIVFYLVIAVMAVTGLMLAALEQNMGPLIGWMDYTSGLMLPVKLVHELLEKVVIVYLVMHLGALLLHRFIHRIPVAQSMFNGYQYHRHK